MINYAVHIRVTSDVARTYSLAIFDALDREHCNYGVVECTGEHTYAVWPCSSDIEAHRCIEDRLAAGALCIRMYFIGQGWFGQVCAVENETTCLPGNYECHRIAARGRLMLDLGIHDDPRRSEGGH